MLAAGPAEPLSPSVPSPKGCVKILAPGALSHRSTESWADLHLVLRVHGQDVGRAYMRERFPDLGEHLKTLVRRIMVESDPEEYDREAADIWSIVEELETAGNGSRAGNAGRLNRRGRS
jgi:hypothetical protein